MEKKVAPKFSHAEAQALFNKAHAAGMAAGEAVRPVPMQVVQRLHPLDDSSPVVKVYEPVMDGVCGFAWVNIRPGNSSFANWLRKQGKGHKGYYGGWEYWVGAFNQSLERKMAYADAFARILEEAGIQAYPGSRMD